MYQMNHRELTQTLRDLTDMVELLASRPLLTIADLAQRYRCDTHTITRWHRLGLLPSPKRIRRTPYWSPQTIIRWELGTVRGRKAAAKGGVQ